MNSNNPLSDILPATVRRYVYAAYVVAGLVIGALAVAGVDVGKAPDVMAYLAIPIGALAASNTSGASEPEAIEYPEDVYLDEDDYAGEPYATDEEVAQGSRHRLYQPGSDEDGFGGDAPVPGPETGSQSL